MECYILNKTRAPVFNMGIHECLEDRKERDHFFFFDCLLSPSCLFVVVSRKQRVTRAHFEVSRLSRNQSHRPKRDAGKQNIFYYYDIYSLLWFD